MNWIDTHSHLNDERFAEDLPAVLARAIAADVGPILVVGIDVPTSLQVVELAAQNSMLYAVVGIQPNSLGRLAPGDWERVLQLISEPKVVGIGETGMDRHWDYAPLPLQEEYFDRHLELADRAQLPVVIHCREADADVVAVLQRFAAKTGRPIRGVMHSFAGDLTAARACLEVGLYISFAGMLTFKKSDALRAVAREVPLERLLVETDAPYLSPHPMRGQRNEPAHVVQTGTCLAEVKGISVAELAAATSANARRLFDRLPQAD